MQRRNSRVPSSLARNDWPFELLSDDCENWYTFTLYMKTTQRSGELINIVRIWWSSSPREQANTNPPWINWQPICTRSIRKCFHWLVPTTVVYLHLLHKLSKQIYIFLTSHIFTVLGGPNNLSHFPLPLQRKSTQNTLRSLDANWFQTNLRSSDRLVHCRSTGIDNVHLFLWLFSEESNWRCRLTKTVNIQCKPLYMQKTKNTL